jgi:endonuclease YncB( thermonuclease family)
VGTTETLMMRWCHLSIEINCAPMVRFLPLALLPLTAIAAAAPLSGMGRAIDGDSLRVGEREVRLFGIDAPEFRQTCMRTGKPWPCGKTAADQLAKLVSGQELSCSELGKDKHGRTLARCRVGEIDINRAMVATGHALAYRRYSTEYVSAEDS